MDLEERVGTVVDISEHVHFDFLLLHTVFEHDFILDVVVVRAFVSGAVGGVEGHTDAPVRAFFAQNLDDSTLVLLVHHLVGSR